MIVKQVSDMAIGEVSRRSGVPASTLRYYESEGLLPEAARKGGKRRYDTTVLPQLLLIRLAKEAGFKISETRTLINGFSRRTPPGRRWRALGEKKLAEVDKQIEQLQIMKLVLQAVTQCECPTFDECAVAMKQRL